MKHSTISPSPLADDPDNPRAPSAVTSEPPNGEGVPLRVCRVCKLELPLTSFRPKRDRTDGVSTRCTSCDRAYQREWQHKNRDKCLRYRRKYHAKNPDAGRERARRRIKADPEAHRQRSRENYRKNPRYYRDYVRRKRAEDPQYRIASTLRGRLNYALRGKKRVGSAVRDAGCTKAELVAHIEAQWTEGMTWDNYGNKDGVRCWEIDHILPLSSFDLGDREQLLRACNYTNLQPLWREQNREKGNKIL